MTKLQQKIIKIFEILRKNNLNPTTELIYSSPFELLVSVVLSAQATDVGVNKATHKLFAIANTPKKILNLGLDGLIEYIKTIGLYNTKAKNVIGLCQQLIDKYQSQVPDDFDALVALPGVGRKTANVVLNTLFGHNLIGVDTHVFRVSNRLGITNGVNVGAVEKQLMQNIHIQYQKNAHHWLILHGRYVCTARNPKCTTCELNQFCSYRNKTI